MKKPVIYVDMYFSNKQIINIGLVLFVFFESTVVIAAPVEDNVLDSILNKYETAAQTWGHVMLNYASWLFWSLVLLSMVWTFGMMVLKRADIQEFLAEMIRFLAVTSFFWWLLYNGPVIANSIIQSMWQIGAKATGQTALSTPSGVVQTGLDILWKMISQISIWSPIDSACGLFISYYILKALTAVGINLLLLFISAWILVYGGVFFLGFGGSQWTSDIAITYYKTALSIGAQLMAMLLLIGVGQSFIDQYYQSMSGGMDLKELAIMLVVANVLHRLTDKVPPMIGSLVGSGGISMGMSGSSSGSIMSSAATAATVISAVGGAMGRGAAALGGGMTALKAAFQQAQQHQAEGSGLFAGGSQAKGEGSGGFRSAMATAGAFAADMGANLAKGVGAIAKEAIADKMDIMKEKIAETSGGKVASEINTPGSTAQARQDRQDIATAHALRQESLGQDARDFMAQYRQANSSESGHSSGLASDHFTENSLSAGDSAPSMEPMNEEIADFVNKKSSKT